MNYFENDYALPVILGSSTEAISVATLLRRESDLKIHIFARKLSLINRLLFKYHKTTSENEDILLLSLIDFSDTVGEYYMPVLILCDETGKAFAEKYFSFLEQRYVIMSAQSTKNSFLKEN